VEKVSEHTARSLFIGGHELQDTLRIWQLFVGRESATIGASLGTLAEMRHLSPNASIAKLRRHGITATADQSVQDAATASHVREDHLLAMIFLPD